MASRVQCSLTAGIAIVGASVVAITPIAVPAAQRVVDASVELAANFTGMSPSVLVGMSAGRLAEQVQQAPYIPLLAALDIAGGDSTRLFTVARSIIDSPLYVADPLLEAAADTLPPSLGGGSDHITNTTLPSEGAIMQFRAAQLIAWRDTADAAVADALGVPANTDANTANGLANGVTASVVRTVSGAALAPVGLVAIAQAIASGDNADLYVAIRQYIDAPLWQADPAITALEKALPESLGGATEYQDGVSPTNGGLKDFRDNTLWGATHDTRVALAGALNVPLDAQDNPIAPSTTLLRTTSTTNDNTPDLTKLKPHVTSLNTQLNDAKGKAEKQVNKAKSDVNKTLKNVQSSLNKVVKKLTPKKADADN